MVGDNTLKLGPKDRGLLRDLRGTMRLLREYQPSGDMSSKRDLARRTFPKGISRPKGNKAGRAPRSTIDIFP